MKLNKNTQTLSLAFISLNFFRDDEPEMAYGAACLKDVFDAGNTKSDKMDVFTFDMQSKTNMEEVAFQIKNSIDWKKYNIIAFSNFAWCEKVFNILGTILDFSNKTVLMGGAMVAGEGSVLEQKYPYVDYFLYSFGEKVFSDLRNNLKQKHIFSLPDFSKLQSPYLTGTLELPKKEMTVRMETRRGCPFNCTYCRHTGIRKEEKQVHQVGNFERYKNELELFKERQVKKINIIDPTFNTKEKMKNGKEFRMEFLHLLQEINIDAEISLQIRPELLDSEFIQEAAKVKGIIFEIGIQTFDEKVLPIIHREKQTEQLVMEKINECKNYGIKIEATLIYNLPYQTNESYEHDVEVLKSAGIKPTSFPLQLYPGTELEEKASQYNLMTKENNYGIQECFFNSPIPSLHYFAFSYRIKPWQRQLTIKKSFTQ